MNKILIWKISHALTLTVLATLCLESLYQAEGAVVGGESSHESQSRPFQALNLTLRGALAGAVDDNPDVLLYKDVSFSK